MKAAIIVASGVGSRYGSDTPKQFIQINNKMVIDYTIQSFINCVDILVLVVSLSYIQMMKDYFNHSKIHCCEGGDSRQESVYKGLNYLQSFSPEFVAIHDGVRMLVTEKLIMHSFDTARKYGSAIPVVPITDSLWYKDTLLSTRCDRNNYVCSQTPQTFNYQQIFLAHQKVKSTLSHYSDCAGVYVSSFDTVASYEGDKNNIKLTTIEDMEYIKFKQSIKI